jgi:hypothetical protein
LARTTDSIVRGVAAGLFAGIPQVLVVQVADKLLGLPREKADIGPRFVGRLAEQLGTRLRPAPRWGLAALFHFGYAAWWGALYGLVDRRLRPSPAVAGSALGGVIYLAAFSPWGAGTQTGTERRPGRRHLREHVLHWTAALTFGLTTAFTHKWLESRSPLPLGEGQGEGSLRRGEGSDQQASRPAPEPALSSR